MCGGQTVRLRNLQARADLNGEVGLALECDSESERRWMIELRNGEGKSVKPDNLEAMNGEGGRVFAFWGDASRGGAAARRNSSRTLGSLPSGRRRHHGGTAERWESLETSGRMAFAPVTEMTEDFMKNAGNAGV